MSVGDVSGPPDTIATMLECPWSNSQLKNLSRHIRDGTEPPANLPSYGEVMLWYNDVAVQVQQDIAARDWASFLDERPFEVSSRPKTIDTLRQKLQRYPDTHLPSVQDVAGVRFEAEMSLDQQDAVAAAIAEMYDHDSSCLHDLRSTPHSGYRAVHIWLRLPVRVEVQVRTHWQSEWANVYEAAADVIGRQIRYGELPSRDVERELVLALQSLSTGGLAAVERTRSAWAREVKLVHERADDADPGAGQSAKAMLESEWAAWRDSERAARDVLCRIGEQLRLLAGKER